MPTEDRDERGLIEDLSRPENLAEPAQRVEFLSTHISLVFRTERSVFKVKRARDYGFLDYSTREARRRFCDAEVRLNRRTAPGVYLGVLPVYRDARGHSLNRPGEIVDHAVHMKRLPDERSALALVQGGELAHADLDSLAAMLARFYREAEEHSPSAETLRTNLEENFEQVRPFAGRLVPRETVEEMESLQRAWFAKHRGLIGSRPARDGHGDLRLEHVYLMPEGPIVIDCIEFLDRFRIADPALDAAFLGMDLARRGRRELGEYFLGRFAYECDDYDFFPLADGYMSYRACVRGKVAGFLASDPGTKPEVAARKARDAGEFFDLSLELLRGNKTRPCVLAVGGVIGAGKTTVAEALGRAKGAPVVVADATRKFLAGIGREEKGPESIYSDAFSSRVREELLRRARAVLESGRSVILDTTFTSRELRGRARELARGAGASFLFVECRAPAAVLRERLRSRQGGLSDAREDLLDRFLQAFEPAMELSPAEHVVVDTSRPLAENVAAVLRAERGAARSSP